MKIFGAVPNFRHIIIERVNLLVDSFYIYKRMCETGTCHLFHLRQKPHHSHQTLDEAVVFAHRIGARQTWLIHSSHDIGRHEEVNASLPPDIRMAYDGQVIII